MNYEFFDHTADAKFRAYGETLEEAFSNAALAMMSLMFDPSPGVVEKKIEIEGNDQKSILYNFLEELLFLIDTEGFITVKVKDLLFTKGGCIATLSGRIMDKKTHQHGEVKAVTYNSMEIGKDKGKVYVQVVVDM